MQPSTNYMKLIAYQLQKSDAPQKVRFCCLFLLVLNEMIEFPDEIDINSLNYTRRVPPVNRVIELG